MNTKLVIGLSGHIGSGKTTAAKYLLQHYSPKACIISLAYPIKSAVQSITNKLLTDSNKSIMRPVLQSYGEAMKKLWGDDYWMNHANQRWKLGQKNHDVMICDDIRFPYEADWIRSLGGVVISIKRPMCLPRVCDHISETSVDLVKSDYVVDNHGSLGSFLDDTRAAVSDYEHKQAQEGREL